MHSYQVMANPLPASDGESSSAATTIPNESQQQSQREKNSVEEAFRAQLTNDSNKKVYIDTLSPEEVAVHRKTGRLPKRTLELIERMLKAQETIKQSSASPARSSSSSVEASDLYDELFLNKPKTN